MKKSVSVWVFPPLIIVLGAAIMAALILAREDPARRPNETKPQMVVTRVVETASLSPQLTAYGRLASAQPVRLISEVAGTLVEGGKPFLPGQSFQRGDLLVQVDDRQARLQIASTKASFLSALAEFLAELRLEYPDDYQLYSDYFAACDFDSSIPTLPEPSNDRIRLFLARYNIYGLYYSIRDAEISLSKYQIRAPFDGAVVSADLRVGAAVRQGSSFGEIVNLEDLEANLAVPVEDLDWIDASRTVRLECPELGAEWSGRVNRISSQIDSRTQTVSVYVSLDNVNGGPRLDGTFVEARLTGKPIEKAVEVPRVAVYGGSYVWVLQDGSLVERPVRVARYQDELAIVESGLSTGDTVVVEALQGVTAGMPAVSFSSGTSEVSE